MICIKHKREQTIYQNLPMLKSLNLEEQMRP